MPQPALRPGAAARGAGPRILQRRNRLQWLCTFTATALCSRVEAGALPPPVLVHEHGAQLGEPFGRVFEGGQDDRASLIV